jgi:hypothetical protein
MASTASAKNELTSPMSNNVANRLDAALVFMCLTMALYG